MPKWLCVCLFLALAPILIPCLVLYFLCKLAA